MAEDRRKRMLNWKESTEMQSVISRSVCILLLMGAQRKECSWGCSVEAMLTSAWLWEKRRAAPSEPSHQEPRGFTAPHSPDCSSAQCEVSPSAPPGWGCDHIRVTKAPPGAQHCVPTHKHPPGVGLEGWVMIQTAQSREPSLFHARAVMVYRWAISLGLPSSQALRRGLQFRTRNLGHRGGQRHVKNGMADKERTPKRRILHQVPVIAANNNGLAAGTGDCCGEFLLWGVPAVVKGLNHAAFLPIGNNLLVTACSHDAVGGPGEGVRRTGMHCQLTLQQTGTPWALNGPCAQLSQFGTSMGPVHGGSSVCRPSL